MEVAVESRPHAASRSAAVSVPFSTNFARLFSIVARARSSIGCATSTRRTLKPAWANTWAMPLPIVPAPITPTVLIIDKPEPRRHEHAKKKISGTFDRQRDAVAAAEAERRDTARQVAPLQRVQERRQDAAAARADRVAERDGAAIHVHFF